MQDEELRVNGQTKEEFLAWLEARREARKARPKLVVERKEATPEELAAYEARLKKYLFGPSG